MELAWSPAAVEDLASAADYIEFDLSSPTAAKRLVESVIEKAQLFADIPGSGTILRTAFGLDTGYRYMVSNNWMIFFACNQEQALVVRILYAKSDYMKKLFKDS